MKCFRVSEKLYIAKTVLLPSDVSTLLERSEGKLIKKFTGSWWFSMNNETSGFDELEARSQNRPSMVINAPISISSLTCKHNEEEASLHSSRHPISHTPRIKQLESEEISWAESKQLKEKEANKEKKEEKINLRVIQTRERRIRDCLLISRRKNFFPRKTFVSSNWPTENKSRPVAHIAYYRVYGSVPPCIWHLDTFVREKL